MMSRSHGHSKMVKRRCIIIVYEYWRKACAKDHWKKVVQNCMQEFILRCYFFILHVQGRNVLINRSTCQVFMAPFLADIYLTDYQAHRVIKSELDIWKCPTRPKWYRALQNKSRRGCWLHMHSSVVLQTFITNGHCLNHADIQCMSPANIQRVTNLCIHNIKARFKYI